MQNQLNVLIQLNSRLYTGSNNQTVFAVDKISRFSRMSYLTHYRIRFESLSMQILALF